MKFTIESKYDKDNIVLTMTEEEVKIIDVKMSYIGNVIKFYYLIEHNNGTRTWITEDRLYNQKG